jgi:decaprenylphospho-beta-D-erythro-pentofuranosid-2-ulose 2-reductase
MTYYVGGVSVGLAATRQLRRQGHGDLVVLSSVAGLRVRQSNLVYGSSKAGLDGFVQGLGDALAGSGVHVLIVRPGWVQSRMTLRPRPAPLDTTPSAVAATEAALINRKDVVWVPALLRPMFAILRLLPPQLWRRVPG